jgi:hypothetical protein
VKELAKLRLHLAGGQMAPRAALDAQAPDIVFRLSHPARGISLLAELADDLLDLGPTHTLGAIVHPTILSEGRAIRCESGTIDDDRCNGDDAKVPG